MNYLLVIGIDQYSSSSFSKLNNAVYDCERIAKVLIEQYSFENIVDPLFNSDATRKRIIETLSNLRFLTTKNDNLVIYFAGHGSMNPNTSKGYWIPSDADNSEADFIPNSTLKDKIEDIETKHILLISDSCFSGTFLTQTRSATSETRHYAELEKLKSRWYIASGRSELVSDGKSGAGSPFSNSLFKVLSENSSKYISVSEILEKVSKLTFVSSNHMPIGGYINVPGHEFGELVFTKIDDIQSLPDIDLNLLMQAHGFYVGQRLQLDSIKTNFKSLLSTIRLVEAKWILSFGRSVDRITSILQKQMGDSWDNILAQVEAQIQEISVPVNSIEDAILFLNLVEHRSQGNIPTPILEVLIINIPEISSSPQLEFIRNYRQSISSESSEKSKGLKFKIDFPKTWKLQDGKRPNVLWVIRSFNNEINVVVTVHLISKMVNFKFTEEELMDTELIAEAMLSPEGIEVIEAGYHRTNIKYRKTIISGCQGATVRSDFKMENLEVEIEGSSKVYYVVYKDFLLTINFMIGNRPTPKLMDDYSLYFNAIVNTLIVFNRYDV